MIDAATRRRGKVLLVDDEQAMLLLLERVLKAEHDVVAVGSAFEALDLLRADGATFDVVLCDMMMPGMSGMELHAALTSDRPTVAQRLVFCTAGIDSPQLRGFLEHVGNRFITKPFHVTTVRAMVRDFVG